LKKCASSSDQFAPASCLSGTIASLNRLSLRTHR
jgi:hypothetical protein